MFSREVITFTKLSLCNQHESVPPIKKNLNTYCMRVQKNNQPQLWSKSPMKAAKYKDA